jgi:hypothetical protein
MNWQRIVRTRTSKTGTREQMNFSWATNLEITYPKMGMVPIVQIQQHFKLVEQLLFSVIEY